MKGIGVKGARQKNGLWSLGGFEGLACGAGLVNGEGLRGTGSLDRFVVKGSAGSVCEGRLRGTGSWWGSAGPVLRSQGTLGQEELSRCRATGIRMSTFLRSLRPAPAAASWSGTGSVPNGS